MSTQCRLAKEKDIEQPVRKHIDIDHCCHDAVNLSSMTQCFEIERAISEEDVKYLERMTVDQAKNVIWVEERLTLLIASKFGDVFCLIFFIKLLNQHSLRFVDFLRFVSN